MIAAAKYLVVMSLTYKAHVTELLPRCPLLTPEGISDDQWNSGQAQMAIGRPAETGDSPSVGTVQEGNQP
jgi:hypothetical protein